MCSIFKKNGLQITVNTNISIVDFLDVSFDLKSKTFKPYSKPGSSHIYVHKQSNHPPIIKQRIPQSIETRLCSISSNAQIFESSKGDYEKALQEAGYQTKLEYSKNSNRTTDHGYANNAAGKEKTATARPNNAPATPNTTPTNATHPPATTESTKTNGNNPKPKRKRNVTWYNPPFSETVETKIGQQFFFLIKKHFPKGNVLHKIFNKNTLKLSYSCMSNIGTIIKSHNSTIISGKSSTKDKCNCRAKDKPDCPLPGRCTVKSVVYEARVETKTEVKTYVGLTANTFKLRYNAHAETFRKTEMRSKTALSKYIWKLKDKGTQYKITWSIKRRAKSYSPVTKRCNLCQWEKFYILTSNKASTLNSRTELLAKCRHKNNCFLSDLK